MHSWQTDGAVSSVAPVSPATLGSHQARTGPTSSTTTSTRAGWTSAIRARYSATRACTSEPTGPNGAPHSSDEMQLDRDAAVVPDHDPHGPVPGQVAADERMHAVDLERRVGGVAREDVGRDAGVTFHHADSRISSVASGRAKNRKGTNVVPSPDETCSTPPARW